jgi:CheY-like chemotaxis protein
MLLAEMPVMDGLTAIRKLREIEAATGRRRLPAIAVTGNARDAQIEIAKQAGFDDVCVKPFKVRRRRGSADSERALTVRRADRRPR